jgi:hypothetical protein
VQQVVGKLSGGIEADAEVVRAMALGNVVQALSQLGITCGCFDERQVGGGRLQVVAQEDGVVAAA